MQISLNTIARKVMFFGAILGAILVAGSIVQIVNVFEKQRLAAGIEALAAEKKNVMAVADKIILNKNELLSAQAAIVVEAKEELVAEQMRVSELETQMIATTAAAAAVKLTNENLAKEVEVASVVNKVTTAKLNSAKVKQAELDMKLKTAIIPESRYRDFFKRVFSFKNKSNEQQAG